MDENSDDSYMDRSDSEAQGSIFLYSFYQYTIFLLIFLPIVMRTYLLGTNIILSILYGIFMTIIILFNIMFFAMFIGYSVLSRDSIISDVIFMSFPFVVIIINFIYSFYLISEARR
jgi:hypothetical protein